MKQAITQTSWIKMILLLFGALLFHFQTYAQAQPTKLVWDGEVGCRIYEDGKERQFSEDIDSGECIRVCERSNVNYTLSGTNLASATWNVTGGVVSPAPNGLSANIEWQNIGGGFIEVTVIKLDGTSQIIQNCVEIIASPIALFQVNMFDKPITCLNTELNFINQSTTNGGTALVSYHWDFDDNTYSNEFQPTHVYTSPGIYEVSLTVTNECNCSDVYTIKLEVLDRPNVTINCPTVVCEGTSATYTVDDQCDGEWKVIGGTVINQTGNSIEVIWNQVDEDGFGYVSYLSHCTCPVWTTVKVPVVKSIGKIKGLNTICSKSQARYTLPQWPTTDFVWEIISSNGSVNTAIINTDQRNEVVVNAVDAGTYILRCMYKNTLLGCSGVAEFLIEVTDPVTIFGDDILLCENTQGNYSASVANAVWTLKKGTNVVTNYNGQNFSHIFADPGSYVLTAIAPGYCESDPIFITIAPKPTPVQGTIVAPTEACLNTSYILSATNDDPANSVLVWSVTNGTFDGSNFGDSVSVQFTSPGTQTISVFKRLKNNPFCESEVVTLTVDVKALTATITNDFALNQFCASSSTQFTANVSFVEYDHLEWVFEDAFGNISPIGNVVSGQYTLHPTVSFNQLDNINPTSSGVLMLIVKKCGEDIRVPFPFTVINNIEISINSAPSEVCALTPFSVVVNTSIPINNGTFNIDYSDGTPSEQVVYSGGYTSQITLTLNNGFANVTDNVGGTISISASNIGGCVNNNVITHNLIIKPTPVVNITSQKSFGICDPNNFSHRLTANLQMNLTNTTLQWYKAPNIPIAAVPGTNNQEVEITNLNGLGQYFVEATAANGCTYRDYAIFSLFDCGGGNSNCQNLNENLIITNTEWTSCNELVVTATYSSNNTTPIISWGYNTEYLTLNSSTSNSGIVTAVFSTTTTGVHDITGQATYIVGGVSCVKTDDVTVKKYYSPDLRYKAVCNSNTNTYTVTIWDNSTYMTDGIVTTAPDVTLSLPNYGSSNTSPLVIYNVPAGIYTATVDLNHPNWITCTKDIVIDLPNLPNLNANISFEQNGIAVSQICDTEPVTLVPPISNSTFTYTWKFSNPQVSNSNMMPTVNLKNSGLVELTIKTKEGCEYNYSRTIIVNENNFVGNIDGEGAFCETDIVTLNYVPIGISNISSYQWMNFNQPIVGANSQTYEPTQSGSYWVVTYTSQGCANYSTKAVNVSMITTPFVSVQGTDGACRGVSFILNGVSENNTYQRRWLRNGIAVTTWNTTTPWERQFTEANAGTYVYTLEVRNPAHPNCVGSYSHTVVVSAPPAVPTLSYQVLSCSPYKVRLTATGNANQYVWSNGMIGSSIEVTEGGPYKVTAVNGLGCEVSSQFDVPKSPEGYLWIFPTGCYSYCGDKLDSERTILGPSPYAYFSSYKWLQNGNNIASGSGSVNPLIQILDGSYQLMLDNGFCQATSGKLNAKYTGRCNECKLEVKQELLKIEKKPFLVYQYYFDIYNPFGEDINVTLESAYGTFSPSSFFIPSGSSIGGVQLNFYPNANFVPGMMEVVFHIQGNQKLQCKYTENWVVPSARPANSNDSENEKLSEIELVSLVVAPNPITDNTIITYELNSKTEHKVQLVVYNMLGVQVWSYSSSEDREDVQLDASRFTSGQYILILRVDNELIKQQNLIKK